MRLRVDHHWNAEHFHFGIEHVLVFVYLDGVL